MPALLLLVRRPRALAALHTQQRRSSGNIIKKEVLHLTSIYSRRCQVWLHCLIHEADTVSNIKAHFNMHEISSFLLRLGYIVPEMYE